MKPYYKGFLIGGALFLIGGYMLWWSVVARAASVTIGDEECPAFISSQVGDGSLYVVCDRDGGPIVVPPPEPPPVTICPPANNASLSDITPQYVSPGQSYRNRVGEEVMYFRTQAALGHEASVSVAEWDGKRDVKQLIIRDCHNQEVKQNWSRYSAKINFTVCLIDCDLLPKRLYYLHYKGHPGKVISFAGTKP